MHRRTAIKGVASLTGALPLAGCAIEDIASDANEEASEEANQAVNETLEEELVRPPNANVDVRSDGSIIVLSLDPGTVGVKCGLIEGDDPVAEVKQSDQAVTTAGKRMQECNEDFLIAVNEAGDVKILKEL
jgi:hypothetical protein